MFVTEANKALASADHLAYVTYPVVNDTKLLFVILKQLNHALTKSMYALLHYDALFKRIPLFPDDYAVQLDLFKRSTAKRYHITKDEITLLEDIKELVNKHKTSTVEFARKDKFVIASRDYRLRTLTIGKVKNYITNAKTFIHKVNEVHKSSDRRFTA